MSYTTIKAIWPGEKHEDLIELPNSHGSAPVIWGEMAERYLGERRAWLFRSDEFWPLYKRQDIPVSMRAVLLMTFDGAYVERKDYARAATDIGEFLRIAPPPVENVNHWPQIAEFFRSNPEPPAIGFHMMSIGDDPFLGEYDEELDGNGPTDWTKCWSVYGQKELSA